MICSDIRNRSWLRGFVRNVIVDRLQIVIATPPCQPFSKLADQPGRSCLQGRLADSAFETALVGQVPWFIIEEVAGLLTSNHGADLDGMRKVAQAHGYATIVSVVDAYRVVPQSRRRALLFGVQGDLASPATCDILRASITRRWAPPMPCLAWWGVPIPDALLHLQQLADCRLSGDQLDLYFDSARMPRNYQRSATNELRLSTIVHMLSRAQKLPQHMQDKGIVGQVFRHHIKSLFWCFTSWVEV